jgi:hypothetical protein
LNEPGFLRCIVTFEQNGEPIVDSPPPRFGRRHQTHAAGPADFDQFWAAGKAALAKLPIDAKITPLPNTATPRPTAIR